MTTPVYPTNYKIYADLGAGWVDITNDVITNAITVEWGIAGNGPLDRMAQTGMAKFTLNNVSKKYSPALPGALAGWSKGTPIKLEITYDGITYIRFRGRVDSTDIDPGSFGNGRVNVIVLDWLEDAATFLVAALDVWTDWRGDQALNAIVQSMPIVPHDDYETGYNVFPTSFDTITPSTKAYAEMSKIALSELGYIYLLKDKVYGETLRFESATTRNGLRALTSYIAASGDSGALLKEDGGYLLKEDGGKILLDETTSFYADNSMNDLEVIYADNLVNRMEITAYPKAFISPGTVLYSLGSPMQIGRGQTITFETGYSSPLSRGRISVLVGTMAPPVATTDYTMYSTPVTGGTDMTASLTVTAVYSTAKIIYTLHNGSSTIGYVRLLQARGEWFDSNDPIKAVQESIPSQAIYGVRPLNIPQQYQQNVEFGAFIGQQILNENKSPHTTLKRVDFWANRSSALMQAFLNLDVGDLVHIKEDQTGINGYYYIQGVRANIMLGGLIKFGWIVKQSFSLAAGLSMMAIEFMGGATQDAINFGYLPQITNLHQKSVSVWVYADTPTTELYAYTIMGNYTGIDDEGGFTLFLRQVDRKINWIQDGVTAGSRGEWETAAIDPAVLLNHWLNIIVTRDSSTVTNLPIIYINGSAVAVTELTAQAGADADETGNPFVIGNYFYGGGVDGYVAPFNGQIINARVYNRILDAREVTELAAWGPNGVGTPSTAQVVLDGLVFETPCVHTAELAAYTDLTLTDETKIIDNVYGSIGSPVGAPVSRLAP